MNPYVHKLNQIISEAVEQIRAIDERELDLKLGDNKWSKKEILGHLIDSAYNNHRRFLTAVNQDHLIFLGYNQEKWVKSNNYQNRAKDEILITWQVVNRHLGHLIENIPDDLLPIKRFRHNFHQICMNPIPETEPASLEYLIWDYIFHLEHHLAQIIPDYQKLQGEFVNM